MTDRMSKVLLAFIAMGLGQMPLFPYSGQMRPLLRPYPVWWAIFSDIKSGVAALSGGTCLNSKLC